MRGPIGGVHPLLAPVLYTFQHAREDLAKHVDGLTTEQMWAGPHGFGSVGFHIRHIAGSTDRLMTYVQRIASARRHLWDRASVLPPSFPVCGSPERTEIVAFGWFGAELLHVLYQPFDRVSGPLACLPRQITIGSNFQSVHPRAPGCVRHILVR
jgi:hypothetical protein